MADVFKYSIHFDGADIDDIQTRYVVASSEEDAEEKMESYREDMVNKGFADFTYWGGWVEIDGVIS